MNLDEDLDNPDSEVELDSLGSFFIHLIDNDYYQDDVEGSQADDVEVIITSSNSDPLPTQKIRQAVRKVRFSHPLAHLDPKCNGFAKSLSFGFLKKVGHYKNKV